MVRRTRHIAPRGKGPSRGRALHPAHVRVGVKPLPGLQQRVLRALPGVPVRDEEAAVLRGLRHRRLSGVRSTAANPRRQTTPAMAHPEPATEPASRSGRHARAPRRRPRTSQSHAGAQESSPRRAEPTTGHRATDTRRSARRPPAPGWAGCAGLSCCSSTEARRARRWPLFRFKAPSYDGLGIHAPKAAATRPLSPSVHSLAS